MSWFRPWRLRLYDALIGNCVRCTRTIADHPAPYRPCPPVVWRPAAIRRAIERLAEARHEAAVEAVCDDEPAFQDDE